MYNENKEVKGKSYQIWRWILALVVVLVGGFFIFLGSCGSINTIHNFLSELVLQNSGTSMRELELK